MRENEEINKKRQRKRPEWTITKNRALYGGGKGTRRDDLQNVFKRLKAEDNDGKKTDFWENMDIKSRGGASRS